MSGGITTMQSERDLIMERLRLGLKRSWWGQAMWCGKAGIDEWYFEDLSETQARVVLAKMTAYGVMFGAAMRGLNGRNSPTPWQWLTLATLAQAQGWEGLGDPRAVQFIRREVGVDHPRFLSRPLMHQALAALRSYRDANKRTKTGAIQAPEADLQNEIAMAQGETA